MTKPEDLTNTLEYYVECPRCKKEIIIEKIFAIVTCSYCRYSFRPGLVSVRHKTHNNPSFRGFRAGE